MPSIRIKRGTRAQIETAASNSQLAQGEPYLITDENRLAIGTSENTFSESVMREDVGTIASQDADNVNITGGILSNVDISNANITNSTINGVTPTQAGLDLLDDASPSEQRATLGLGTAATKDIGTQGDTVPLLSGDNVFSGSNVFPTPTQEGNPLIKGNCPQEDPNDVIWYTKTGVFRIEGFANGFDYNGLLISVGDGERACHIYIDGEKKDFYYKVYTPNIPGAPPVWFWWRKVLTDYFVHFQERRPLGENAGDSVAGLNVRELNTIVFNSIPDAFLQPSTKFYLPPGQYYIEAKAPAVNADRHKLRLYNTTTSSYITSVDGSSEWTFSQNHSFVSGRFTLENGSRLELHHYITTAQQYYGLGVATNFGDFEVYTDVKVWKI